MEQKEGQDIGNSNGHNFLGNHVLAEFYDCSVDVLNDERVLQEAMETSVEIAGATLVKSVFHQYSPHGISGVVVIQESHFAIHTWPEHQYAAVDFFTCNPEMDYQGAYEHMAAKLKSERHSCKLHQRGQIDVVLNEVS